MATPSRLVVWLWVTRLPRIFLFWPPILALKKLLSFCHRSISGRERRCLSVPICRDGQRAFTRKSNRDWPSCQSRRQNERRYASQPNACPNGGPPRVHAHLSSSAVAALFADSTGS